MSSTVAQSQYWMCTINNPTSDDIPACWEGVTYAVWQAEKGAEGTEHLQVYVIFDKKKRMTALKKINARAHWDPRYGTHQQAKEYCTKEDTRMRGPWEVGEEPADKEQGKRNDLLSLKRKLDEGKTESEIASDPETFPVWARYHKVVARYRMLTGKQRDWPTFTQVIWGRPGLGKTRLARDMAGPAAYWLPRPAGQTAWFDGYIGQDIIVIDEFYGWLSLDLLCRVLDRYPMQVETKGGAFPLTVKKVIITSNVPPAQWYKLPPERTAALFRRLEMPLGTIQHMLVPYTGPDAAPAPPVDLIVDQDFSQIMQRSLLECEEAPLTVEELGGDHLDPYEWVDVETPFYGAQR